MDQIQFDDIKSLQDRVSDEFGDWGNQVEVTQEKINQFAELTGDHQWIHIDIERAKKESPFGGPIAHGFLTLSLLPSLHPKANFVIVGMGNVTNYGADGFRFLSPVPSGAKLHARSRLANAQAKPKGTLITMETAVHVVGSERPALIYNGLTLYNPPLG